MDAGVGVGHANLACLQTCPAFNFWGRPSLTLVGEPPPRSARHTRRHCARSHPLSVAGSVRERAVPALTPVKQCVLPAGPSLYMCIHTSSRRYTRPRPADPPSGLLGDRLGWQASGWWRRNALPSGCPPAAPTATNPRLLRQSDPQSVPPASAGLSIRGLQAEARGPGCCQGVHSRWAHRSTCKTQHWRAVLVAAWAEKGVQPMLTWHNWLQVDERKRECRGDEHFAGLYGVGSESISLSLQGSAPRHGTQH
jgi:hypothetical protein